MKIFSNSKRQEDFNLTASGFATATVQLFQTSIDVTFDPGKVKGNIEDHVQKINKQLDWLSSNKMLIDE